MPSTLQWITSAGGPLVCIEEELLCMWIGNRGLGSLESDYERACKLDAYLGVLEIGNKHGLILGDMPLATCVSTDMKGLPCIVRAVYLDDDDNVLEALRNTDLSNCPEIEQSIFYMNEHSTLCLFDAALTGYEANSERLRFSIFPGTYQVTTHALEPSDRVSLVVHGFRVHS